MKAQAAEINRISFASSWKSSSKRVMVAFAFLVGLSGCNHNPPAVVEIGKPPATEAEMQDIASKECMVEALRNVDRPFEADIEPGGIWIDPSDPVLVQCVLHCTHGEGAERIRSLFLVTFDNLAYPEFASSREGLRCVLVNRDGKVVFIDREFWDGDTHEELLQAGAADSDGPPAIALGLLELAELRQKYASP